jgi:hypothetical protein
MKTAKRIVIAFFSAGWVIPAFLSCDAYLEHLADIHSRGLSGAFANSFPFLQFSKQMLAISASWLFLVILAWAYVVAGAIGGILPNKLLQPIARNRAPAEQ